MNNSKKRRRYDPNKPRQPRGKLEINVGLLQDLLWKHRQYPPYFDRYRYSPELMKIFKILVDKPSFWENGIQYNFPPDDKLYLVFGSEHRRIVTYKAECDFMFNLGYLWDTDESLLPTKLEKARQVYKNDLLLLRVDDRNDNESADIQILSHGLFQDLTEDYKVFTINKYDMKQIRSNLKLVEGKESDEYFNDHRYRNGVTDR